ncbi:acyl-CoA dehydrogenase [Stakelama saccharophila]|uniref:Acyl-CoA dehydrogenase n=1 Tax=Stakelama saccharophila TaxID=3075605 RepID=A0ABZ0B8J9_9SPHN|nr:acyl-CoA dehydrogenase [Stakelama sp. W311]WNO53750.1 acyl-CoA dehydrogenase [Stakelama sp. W311]
MTAQLIRRDDIDFLLHDWLRADKLVDRDTIDAILDLSEKLASEAFLTHYKRSDVEEPAFEDGEVRICPAIGDALAQYAELGLFSAGFPEEQGGLGLPYLVCMASFAYFAAANVATAAYPMLTVANARLIAAFGTEAQIDTFARPEIDGRWFGTMCLSEPQAGSSLADVRTRAVLDGRDALGERYRLTGNKMWISGGDHDASENIVHLVLAKVPREDGTLPEGTAGISLFIVPKIFPDGARNDVTVAGINHKMGYRGTTNCLLNFGENGGALGWIVGKPGDGLRQMFQMMNEARIGVGTGAAAMGYRSYLLSATYARERLQGRPAGRRSGNAVAIIEHPDVRRMLLQQKCYVEGALALCLYCARLVDTAEDCAEDAALLGLLTPVAKTWSSEHGLAANDIAIQIHGGYGYTRDFDVEQLWRDNRLNPIHEGTTGIQAIDLVGRKILRDGAGLLVLEVKILETAEMARDIPGLAEFANTLSATWRTATETIQVLRRREANAALDNATPFLRAFGHVVTAWLWLDQVVAAYTLRRTAPANTKLAKGKHHACRFFFEWELPRVGPMLTFIASKGDVAATAPAGIFG